MCAILKKAWVISWKITGNAASYDTLDKMTLMRLIILEAYHYSRRPNFSPLLQVITSELRQVRALMDQGMNVRIRFLQLLRDIGTLLHELLGYCQCDYYWRRP